MKLYLSLNIIFLSLTTWASAQSVTIKGSIYSAPAQPLKGVTLLIKGTVGKQRSMTSEETGKFQFIVPKENAAYSLKASHIGYASLDTIIMVSGIGSVKEINLKPIYLKQEVHMLNAVNIQAKAKVVELSGNKVIFNVSRSPIASGKSLYDAMKQVPGVFEQNNTLSFQGNRIEVYIDGRQNFLTGNELKTYLQSLPATSVDIIEVLPTPSSKYDARGGSVINVKSKASSQLGTNGNILLGAGQGKFFQNNQALNLNHRSQSTNIYGSYSHYNSKKYYRSFSDRVQDADLNVLSNEDRNRTSDSHSLKAGADFIINKNNSIGILIKANFIGMDRSGNSSAALDYARSGADSISYINTQGKSNYFIPSVNLFYRSVLDTANRTLSLNFDYFRYDKSFKNNYRTSFFEANGVEYRPQSSLRDNSPTLNDVYAFALDFSNPLKKGSFEAGLKSYLTTTNNDITWELLDGVNWVVDNTRTNHFIYKEFINAAYANYNLTFKKLSIAAGLRYELTSTNGRSVTLDTLNKRTYGNLFPNVNINYNASSNHVFNASYRKSIQRFGFDVVNPFIFYRSPYEYSRGNPNIRPEISHSAKLGYTYKGYLSFKVNYTRANQALAPVYIRSSNNVLIATQDNLSNSNTFYFSNDVYTTIKKFWDLSISNMAGFIQYNQFVNGANVLDNSKWIYQSNVSNSFTLGKSWSAEIFAMYLSPFSQGIFKTRTLFQVDMGLSKSLLSNKAALRLSVSDVFNTFKNRYTVNYQGVNAYYNEKDESRFVNASFTYKFGNSKVKASKSRKINSDDIRSRMQ